MQWIFALKIAAIVIASYFIGNINFAIIISRRIGRDIRNEGSGNPGTINMLRTFGFGKGALTLVCDAIKCAIPVIASYFFMYYVAPEANFGFDIPAGAPQYLGYYISGYGKAAMLISGASCIVGHCFPVCHRFNGGKGIACTIGLAFAIDPIIAIICFGCAVIYLVVSKYGCIASFIVTIPAVIAEIIYALVWGDSIVIVVLCVLIIAIILFAHRKNLVRLANGTEASANLIDRYKKSKARPAEQAEKENVQ